MPQLVKGRRHHLAAGVFGQSFDPYLQSGVGEEEDVEEESTLVLPGPRNQRGAFTGPSRPVGVMLHSQGACMAV